MKYIKYCLALLLALTVTATLFRPAATMAKYVDKAEFEDVDFTLYTNQKTYEIENIAADGDLTELADGEIVDGYLMRYGLGVDVDTNAYEGTELRTFGEQYGDGTAANSTGDFGVDGGIYLFVATRNGKGIYVVDSAGSGHRNIEWYALCNINAESKYYVRFGLGIENGVKDYQLWREAGDECYWNETGYPVDKDGNVWNVQMTKITKPHAYQFISEEYVDADGYTCVDTLLYTGMRIFINGDREATEKVLAEDLRNEESGIFSCILDSNAADARDEAGIGFTTDYQHASGADGLRYFVSHVMIVDLTETFGRGNEPPLWWCDQYIPWVDENTAETQTVQWFPEASYSAWDYEFHSQMDGFYGMGYYEEEDRVNVGVVDAVDSGTTGTELYDVNPVIVNPTVPISDYKGGIQ